MNTSNEISNEDIFNEIKRLQRNISKRVTRIEHDETLPQDTAERFRELEQQLPTNISDVDDKTLRTIYRDLRYIDNLKTSTVRGATSARDNFNPIMERLNKFSQKVGKDKFWSMYEKLLEVNANFEKFKYEIFDALYKYVENGDDEDKAVDEIRAIYDNSLMDVSDLNISEEKRDERATLLFTSRLQELGE